MAKHKGILKKKVHVKKHYANGRQGHMWGVKGYTVKHHAAVRSRLKWLVKAFSRRKVKKGSKHKKVTWGSRRTRRI